MVNTESGTVAAVKYSQCVKEGGSTNKLSFMHGRHIRQASGNQRNGKLAFHCQAALADVVA